jgi:hypothetical protein
MVGTLNRRHTLFAADFALTFRTALGAVGGGIPVADIKSPLVALELPRTAGAISKIVRTGDHEPLGIDPRRHDVVGSSEFVFVLPLGHAAEANA